MTADSEFECNEFSKNTSMEYVVSGFNFQLLYVGYLYVYIEYECVVEKRSNAKMCSFSDEVFSKSDLVINKSKIN